MKLPAKTPAVFLDRDGTLNTEKGYLHDWGDWQWLAGVPQALSRLQHRGFTLVVVTNQAGIARGLYGADEVEALHQKVNQDLSAFGAVIEAFYYCPHHPDFSGGCDCRKPKAGLLLRAAADLCLDLNCSFMIGDKLLDIQAGLAAGCQSILVRTGYGRSEEKLAPQGVCVIDDLPKAAAYILRNSNRK
ncbi:MAG: D-glycero-beta-D-manno-heptose 1,7-bisphosphate 7-phosphatase [Desulfovibrio sp.]|jgi:D-glycero-D-manno-heptose 1,7-bisphosphate phosphatase|nr:D-glycero-beta-D-manno-heptose 1,7-bisphosphate 7-phosphatase [Desulfovibrio sp.]